MLAPPRFVNRPSKVPLITKPALMAMATPRPLSRPPTSPRRRLQALRMYTRGESLCDHPATIEEGIRCFRQASDIAWELASEEWPEWAQTIYCRLLASPASAPCTLLLDSAATALRFQPELCPLREATAADDVWAIASALRTRNVAVRSIAALRPSLKAKPPPSRARPEAASFILHQLPCIYCHSRTLKSHHPLQPTSLTAVSSSSRQNGLSRGRRCSTTSLLWRCRGRYTAPSPEHTSLGFFTPPT